MNWRRLSWVCIAMLGGCLERDDLIDGAFTPDQWARLQQAYKPEPLQTPDPAIADLGQQMFFDPAFSANGQVSCATCHDPTKWFIDSHTPNNVSQGVKGPTARNSMTLVNSQLKERYAKGQPAFSWAGGWLPAPNMPEQLATAGSVLHLAIVKPMASTPDAAVKVVLNSTGYSQMFAQAFPGQQVTFANLEVAMDAYLERLTSLDAPFDLWLRGDDSPQMSDAAKRGFAVFVGPAGCAECHSGPLFSDLQFHDTGVPQTGSPDLGRGPIDGNAADSGAFLTGTLRQIALTAPYMHDGLFRTLPDVIAFYRAGGASGDFAGTRDPRIVPLDITDDDALDLEAFLESLTGAVIPSTDPRTHAKCPSIVPDVCAGDCYNLQTDPHNCGGCGRACGTYETCIAGTCGPAVCTAPDGNNGEVCAGVCADIHLDPNNCGGCGNVCPSGICMESCIPQPTCGPTMLACGLMCVDPNADPMNCGSCGHMCATACQAGQCVP